jgi:hypothetical protein
MNTLDTALDALDVEVTDILEELDRLRAVNKQLAGALHDAVCIFNAEPGETQLAPKWFARAIEALDAAGVKA